MVSAVTANCRIAQVGSFGSAFRWSDCPRLSQQFLKWAFFGQQKTAAIFVLFLGVRFLLSQAILPISEQQHLVGSWAGAPPTDGGRV